LCGETGTGKDLAAQAIHDASPRADKPFVVVDCSSIPAGLVEAELFGHEQGAFPGADRHRPGALLEAHGGTVFFDEIGKLPFDLQPKLLRALENRQVRPLGASKPVNVDVRVVVASDRDLRLAVNRGAFREDLFYRLNVVNVQLPPLRERPDDIPLLATHFYRELTGDGEGRLPREQLDALVRHDWPGNVRELRNTIEQMVALAGVAEVPAAGGANAASLSSTPVLPSYKQAKAKAASEFERRYLVPLLGATRGNVSEAARMARMDRVNLIKLLRKHNITPTAAATGEPVPPGRARVPG
jgi:two-component system, NtrC family, response regulator GlrR